MKQSNTNRKTHYEILNVGRNADRNVIKKSYRTLALRYHPDRSSDPDAESRMKEINVAYEVLSDPDKRALYDRTLPPDNVRKESSPTKKPPKPEKPKPADESGHQRDFRYSASDAYGFGVEYGYCGPHFDPFEYARRKSKKRRRPNWWNDIHFADDERCGDKENENFTHAYHEV